MEVPGDNNTHQLFVRDASSFLRLLDLLHRLEDLAVLFKLDDVAVGEGSDHIVDIGLYLEEVGHYLISIVILEVLCGLAF